MKRRASAHLKKIFLVEDHSVYAEGLLEILRSEPGLAICGQVGSAKEALRDIPGLNPDLVLVDVTIPGLGGLNLINQLRARFTEIKLLVLSTRQEQLYAARMLRAGADGYVTKQQDPDEVVYAVHDVLAGRVHVGESVMTCEPKFSCEAQRQPRSHPIDALSDLERGILNLWSAGKSNPEIASSLGLKAKSLAAHYARMRKKMR
jgi:DNA-binding NarL/FixJ family response regulator